MGKQETEERSERRRHLTQYRLISICLCIWPFEGSRWLSQPIKYVTGLHPSSTRDSNAMPGPATFLVLTVASSARVLYGIAWEGAGSGVPNPAPFCYYSLTRRDPELVDPPFQVSRCAGNNRDLQTGQRSSGCVVNGCTETVYLSDSPYSSLNLFLRHTPQPPPPRIPKPPFLFRPWAPNQDALQTQFYSAGPHSDSGGSLPHPHLFWSGSVCLQSLECEWITSERICLRLTVALRAPSPPPALRIRSGMREGNRLRGVLLPPLLAPSAMPHPYQSPGSLPPPLPLLLVPPPPSPPLPCSAGRASISVLT